MILAIFDLQVALILSTKFLVTWPFQLEIQIDFQDSSHLGFPIRIILAILYLQVTPIVPTKFRVS